MHVTPLDSAVGRVVFMASRKYSFGGWQNLPVHPIGLKGEILSICAERQPDGRDKDAIVKRFSKHNLF